MSNKKIDILLIEDNPGDIELTRAAFESEDLTRLQITRDGEEALEYLRANAGDPSTPNPDIIILDLNLPKMDGWEVLSELKQDDVLKSIPVVVMSSSLAEKDVDTAYKLHANCYVAKPNSAQEYINMVRSVDQFWSQACRLPSIAAV